MYSNRFIKHFRIYLPLSADATPLASKEVIRDCWNGIFTG